VVGDTWTGQRAKITEVKEIQPVSGTVYGSAPILYVVMLLGVWALLEIMGLWNVGAAIGTAIAMIAIVWTIRRQATVAVSDTGVRLGMTSPLLPGFDKSTEIPWDNILGIKSGWLSGSVAFKHPQKLTRRTRMSMTISFLDPKWKSRPTTTAIVARLESPLG